MSAKDAYHSLVRNALENEGWTITSDPLFIRFLGVEMRIDLGGERVIAAEKGNEKIAVEIKSFFGSSVISEFYDALGQYMNYLDALDHVEPNRVLYLAVPIDAYETFFLLPYGQHVIQRYKLKLIVYKTTSEEIVKWIQ